MKYFDQIFVISLNNEVGWGRTEVIWKELQEQDIQSARWTATEHENGVVGLLQTMHQLFTYAVANNEQNVLVLEDDNHFLVPFWPAMDEIWPQVPKDYHCLFLSCNLLSRPERVSRNILRIRSSYSTNAIVYSLEAMKLIVPLIEKNPTTAYDILLMKHIQPLGKSYCTLPMLSNQRAGYSSIEKKEIDWAEYQRQSFRMYTHNI
jgi:GR25 family glycosyltransferase involved in LPS biosynthesis